MQGIQSPWEVASRRRSKPAHRVPKPTSHINPCSCLVLMPIFDGISSHSPLVRLPIPHPTCHHHHHQVEWLVMRAMSLKLVKGMMDEVERVVHVSWVQPRVLEDSQLTRLAERLGEWRGRVDEAHMYVEDQTPELFG